MTLTPCTNLCLDLFKPIWVFGLMVASQSFDLQVEFRTLFVLTRMEPFPGTTWG